MKELISGKELTGKVKERNGRAGLRVILNPWV